MLMSVCHYLGPLEVIPAVNSLRRSLHYIGHFADIHVVSLSTTWAQDVNSNENLFETL
jgi:hypothetical protein